jgi:hypothetical protein
LVEEIQHLPAVVKDILPSDGSRLSEGAQITGFFASIRQEIAGRKSRSEFKARFAGSDQSRSTRADDFSRVTGYLEYRDAPS